MSNDIFGTKDKVPTCDIYDREQLKSTRILNKDKTLYIEDNISNSAIYGRQAYSNRKVYSKQGKNYI